MYLSKASSTRGPFDYIYIKLIQFSPNSGILSNTWAGEAYNFINLQSDTPDWADVSISATSGSLASLDPEYAERLFGMKREVNYIQAETYAELVLIHHIYSNKKNHQININ